MDSWMRTAGCRLPNLSRSIVFNELFVLANMPIQRFGSTLMSKGQFGQYIDLLKNAYQPANLDNVMCRSLVSVDWRGLVYDCDFNQMLGSTSTAPVSRPLTAASLAMRRCAAMSRPSLPATTPPRGVAAVIQ